MQKRGVIYRDLGTKEVFITKTGVRFGAGVSSVVLIQDEDELEKQAQFWHWGQLKILFDFLKDAPYNNALTSRKMSSTELLIPRLPAPNAPFPVIPDSSLLAFVFALFLKEPRELINWLAREAETPNNSRKRLTAPFDLLPTRSRRLTRGDRVVSPPLPSPYLSSMRLRLASSRRSYSRSSGHTIRDDVTLSSDTSDSTL